MTFIENTFVNVVQHKPALKRKITLWAESTKFGTIVPVVLILFLLVYNKYAYFVKPTTGCLTIPPTI